MTKINGENPKVKRIFKYPTGAIIPEGAVFLSTVKQDRVQLHPDEPYINCWLVWHYFLVEVEDTGENIE